MPGRISRLALLLAFIFLACTGTAYAQTSTWKTLAQSGDAYVAYDDRSQTWEIGTDGISRRMDFDPGGGYRLISLKNKLTNREWLAPASGTSAELHLELSGQVLSGGSPDFALTGSSVTSNPDGSLELEVGIARGPLHVQMHYVAFPKTDIVEQWVRLENTGTTGVNMAAVDSISFSLQPSADELMLYWVQGLNPSAADPAKPLDDPVLRLRSTKLSPAVEQVIGSNGRSSEGSMGWFVLAAPSLAEGLFGGIEWSGAWQLSAQRQNGATAISAGLQDLRFDLEPGTSFESPRRFIGFYRGTLDDAANASHDFARLYLLRPRPANFPWTQYNTWFAYYTDLDEERLKQEVDSAAELGLELFYVDAGWYEGSPAHADFSWGLGTWAENRDKFPSGLASFADYVHSRGLKFGLWVEPERVDLRYVGPDKEISKDWLAPGTAFDAPPPAGLPQSATVCLGHPEARAWMKAWLARIVRDYKLDWLKWDDNAWFSCDPPGQAGNGDYAHVLGLYEVLDYLRQEFPNLIIENCASGGHRMDYALMRRTDIAWLSDETDPSYRVRYHLFGASYPFPAEYLNSWVVESYWEHLEDGAKDPAELRAWLRSRMMGAFGLSVGTLGWTADLRAAVANEIKQYKTYRDTIVRGQEFHLLPQTDIETSNLEPPTEPDAIQFYDPAGDRSVVFLFKGVVPWTQRHVRLKGLDGSTVYRVQSADGQIALQGTGSQLANQAITFPYADTQPSSILIVTGIH